MTKNLTVRRPDDVAADAEALARIEGTGLNGTVQQSLIEAVERRAFANANYTLRRVSDSDGRRCRRRH